MTQLSAAIDAWHQLLDQDGAGDSQAAMEDGLRRRGLFFGDRPLCNVLRPRLLTSGQYGFLARRCGLLLRAFDRAHKAAMAQPSLLEQFALTGEERSLLEHDPGFAAASPHSRIDAFFLPDAMEFKLTEFNGENPTGASYNDALTEVFLALPVTRAFMRSHHLRPLPARHGMLHALLAAWQQFSGRRTAPRVAILDWPEVPTYAEFVLFQQYFREHGIEAVIADPREARLQGDRLIVAGAPVDVIYKRVLISELLERCGRNHDVVRAVERGLVCMVNPFRCKILHKKASLAVLSDERNAGLFSPDEAEAISAHIPWTRLVEARNTTHDSRTIDLLPFMIENRSRLVLKPNDAYGGSGIVLGWETGDDAWQKAVGAALDEPHVVQERVTIPREPYPGFADAALLFADRILDTDPFGCHGEHVEGCLSRLSTAALVNVTAGGGSQVPTFLVEAR